MSSSHVDILLGRIQKKLLLFASPLFISNLMTQNSDAQKTLNPPQGTLARGKLRFPKLTSSLRLTYSPNWGVRAQQKMQRCGGWWGVKETFPWIEMESLVLVVWKPAGQFGTVWFIVLSKRLHPTDLNQSLQSLTMAAVSYFLSWGGGRGVGLESMCCVCQSAALSVAWYLTTSPLLGHNFHSGILLMPVAYSHPSSAFNQFRCYQIGFDSADVSKCIHSAGGHLCQAVCGYS